MRRYPRNLTLSVIAVLLLVVACSPGLRYNQHIQAVSVAEGLDVEVVYEGSIFWSVSVTNNLQESVKLVWDESVYVTTLGSSTRLIRGKTRKNYASQAQPPSPIPPGASLQEAFTAEAWAQHAGRGVVPQPSDPNKSGRIYLTFEYGGRKVAWEARVSFILANQ